MFKYMKSFYQQSNTYVNNNGRVNTTSSTTQYNDGTGKFKLFKNNINVKDENINTKNYKNYLNIDQFKFFNNMLLPIGFYKILSNSTQNDTFSIEENKPKKLKKSPKKLKKSSKKHKKSPKKHKKSPKKLTKSTKKLTKSPKKT